MLILKYQFVVASFFSHQELISSGWKDICIRIKWRNRIFATRVFNEIFVEQHSRKWTNVTKRITFKMFAKFDVLRFFLNNFKLGWIRTLKLLHLTKFSQKIFNENLRQTLIFFYQHLWNPMLFTLNTSNHKSAQIKHLSLKY